MDRVINWIIAYSLKNGIVSEDNIPWFRYGIEKRLTTTIVMIPFFLLAVLLTNFSVACVFLLCFYLLRSRMNGYHANKFIHCLIHSLLLEITCLLLVYPILNHLSVYTLSIICFFLIFILAPYNHPNMHLNKEELYACKISSRIRISCITVCNIIICALGFLDYAKGIILGTMMAVYLLCLAYLRKGGTDNEECKRDGQECNERIGHCND